MKVDDILWNALRAFIQDCIDMFGINGSEEYNAGYDELVRQVSRQVLNEEE